MAYSGQCFISHAHTGRSANRGDCNQACRLPYEVLDANGRIIAHEKHVLSMKDNNQTDNMRALVDAGVRSFKIEGRYKDMAYVKNITAHYRKILDEIIEEREFSDMPLARSSSARPHSPSRQTPTRTSTASSPTTLSTAAKTISARLTPPKPQGAPWAGSRKWATSGWRWRAATRPRCSTTVMACATTTCKRNWWASHQPCRVRQRQKRHLALFPKNEISEFKDLRKAWKSTATAT